MYVNTSINNNIIIIKLSIKKNQSIFSPHMQSPQSTYFRHISIKIQPINLSQHVNKGRGREPDSYRSYFRTVTNEYSHCILSCDAPTGTKRGKVNNRILSLQTKYIGRVTSLLLQYYQFVLFRLCVSGEPCRAMEQRHITFFWTDIRSIFLHC